MVPPERERTRVVEAGSDQQGKRGSRMRQEFKTMLIVGSATLGALHVHHALEQAQASARPFVSAKLPEVADTNPIFQ